MSERALFPILLNSRELLFLPKSRCSSSSSSGASLSTERLLASLSTASMMTVRGRVATAVVAVMAVVSSVVGRAEAMKCYTCNNCIKYELSQSQTCKAGYDVCMKLDMESGQVQRRCGTKESCQNSEKLRTRYLDVNCCSEDNCNSSTSLTPPPHAVVFPFLLFLLLPFLVLFLLSPSDPAALAVC